MTLAHIDLWGYWLGIFLTFCILSFLYKDNPFYKLAEHIFIGVSIGYVITQQYYNVLRPKMVVPFGDALGYDPKAHYHGWFGARFAQMVAHAHPWGILLAVIPLALVAMMFVKAVSRRWAWVGRYPLAFVVAFYAGIQINAVAQADLGQQIKRSVDTLDVQKVDINQASLVTLQNLPGMSPKLARMIIKRRKQKPFTSVGEIDHMPGLTPAEHKQLAEGRGKIEGLDARASVRTGERYWFGIFSRVLMLLGLLASLIYFHFSVEHKGVVGKISRFGIWVLMIGFGASFGYTVQGRLALAIGRALDVLGYDKAPALARRIHGPVVALVSIAVIVAGIVIWELRQRPGDQGGGSGGSGESPESAAGSTTGEELAP